MRLALVPRRIKSRIAHALCSRPLARLVTGLSKGRIRSRGLVFNVDAEIYSNGDRARLFWNIFERHELDLIRHIPPDIDVVDLGAGTGIVTSHVLHSLDEGRTLVAVEANPRALPVLQSNLAKHGAGRTTVVVHAAIAYGTSEPKVQFSIAETLTSSLHGQVNHALNVPAATLKSVLQANDLDEYALVADIEGAELELFRSEDAALSACRQIVIELHERSDESPAVGIEDLVALIVQHGFQVRERRGNVFAFAR